MWLVPRVDRVDELGHDVEDQHALTCIGEGQGEREPDVTGADDGYIPGAVHGELAYRAAAMRPLALPSP